MGEINFRMVGDSNASVISYKAYGDNMEAVCIPSGYAQSIVNVGDTDMVALVCANEICATVNSDTFRLEV